MTKDDVATPSFTKSRYAHLSNSQRDKAIAAGAIELLDATQRIYRAATPGAGRRFFIASSANGSGAVSMEVPKHIQHLIAAEITGQHAASIPGQ